MSKDIVEGVLVPGNDLMYFEQGSFLSNGVVFINREVERDRSSELRTNVYNCTDLWDQIDVGCELSDKLFINIEQYFVRWAVKKHSGIIRNTVDYDVRFNYCLDTHHLKVIRTLGLTEVWECSKYLNIAKKDFSFVIQIPRAIVTTDVLIGFQDVFEHSVGFTVNRKQIIKLLQDNPVNDFMFDLDSGRLIALNQVMKMLDYTQLSKCDTFKDNQYGFPIYMCRSMLAYLAFQYNEWYFDFSTAKNAVVLNKQVLLRSKK